MIFPAKFRPSKGTLLRVLADVLLLNLSLAGAAALRLLGNVFWEGTELSRLLVNAYASFYLASAPLLTVLAVSVFHGFGIYTRTRFYGRKSKAITLFQAISTAYLLFAFVVYFLFWDLAAIPRAILVISYCGTLLLCGGSRLIKNFAASRYEIVPRGESRRGGVQKVLVVGGAGYIGSLLSRRLLADGYAVRILDLSMYGREAISDLAASARFEFVEGDLRHVEAVVRAVKGCDAVIHLGAIVGDPACDLNERTTREINTFATKLLLQVARGYGVQRLLFASTCAVYGASDHLMSEQSPLNPVSLYAQSKADAERVVLEAKSRDFSPVVLRLGTVFGQSYRPRFDLVVNLLVAKAWKDKAIKIFNRDQWRPFVHVSDVADAFGACLKADSSLVSGEIYNVGSTALNLTLGELAEKVRAELPGTQVEYLETGDRRNYRVSCDKIQSQLGFSCKKSIEDGIREVRQFLEQTQGQELSLEQYDNSRQLRALLDAGWVASSDALFGEMIGGRREDSDARAPVARPEPMPG